MRNLTVKEFALKAAEHDLFNQTITVKINDEFFPATMEMFFPKHPTVINQARDDIIDQSDYPFDDITIILDCTG